MKWNEIKEMLFSRDLEIVTYLIIPIGILWLCIWLLRAGHLITKGL